MVPSSHLDSAGIKKYSSIVAHDIACKALITNEAIFADRPPAPVATRFLSNNQHIIHMAGYGPLWRLLCRNLASGVLHSSQDIQLKLFNEMKGVIIASSDDSRDEETSTSPLCGAPRSHRKYSVGKDAIVNLMIAEIG
ncbi:hypothetical protein IFM89_020898 [Coptis chinensis]|uniref:Cytochrome P450 n=1 Tax=Coptis chinensis TaxID=261450 RepID=A0A835M3A8_9MAGN|nr:hypothetical protein IFM89_020898 [Coptis chinensis]